MKPFNATTDAFKLLVISRFVILRMGPPVPEVFGYPVKEILDEVKRLDASLAGMTEAEINQNVNDQPNTMNEETKPGAKLTPDQITEILHQRADSELRTKLNAIYKQVDELYGRHAAVRVQVRELGIGDAISNKNDLDNYIHVGSAARSILTDCLFESIVEDYRKRYVQEWMNNLERLHEETTQFREMFEQNGG